MRPARTVRNLWSKIKHIYSIRKRVMAMKKFTSSSCENDDLKASLHRWSIKSITPIEKYAKFLAASTFWILGKKQGVYCKFSCRCCNPKAQILGLAEETWAFHLSRECFQRKWHKPGSWILDLWESHLFLLLRNKIRARLSLNVK